MHISSRLDAISESKTLAITSRAAELRAEGKDIISLSAGEPDFATPEPVAEAGIRAIREGKTRYTSVPGMPELRKRVTEHLARDFQLDYDWKEVCITASVKAGLSLALLALAEPGDKVVLPAPYWVSYPEVVGLSRACPEILQCSDANGFIPTVPQLEAALSAEGVRGFILNSPSNPSGAVWSESQLTALVEICAANDVWILSDEIYARVTYEGVPSISPANIPGGKERTIVLNGLSKVYAMTGWRIGYVAAPRELIQAITALQSHALGNPPTISQYAAMEAFSERGVDYPAPMLEAFTERRAWLCQALQNLPGFTLNRPMGAFYVFPGVQAILEERGIDALELARLLLDEAGVAVVPGTAFGAPGHIRLSFAASLEQIQEAMRPIEEWLKGRS